MKRLQIIYSLVFVLIPHIAFSQLLINEFSSKGNFEDSNGNAYDWVEIINSSSSSVNLSDYFLTDNFSNLNKFELPNIILPADSLILFFLSGTSHSNYHANFKLSLGEDIIISDSNNIVIDSKTVTTALPMISEGRILDGDTNWGFFNLPTPGSSNNSSSYYMYISDPPILSLESGWYNQDQVLIIHADSLSNIYYTTNGDIPDINDNLYIDTVFLDSTTIISARVFTDSSYLPSKVIDRTYIFNEDNFELPVFSIITDSLNLWDWNTGIYVLGPNANSSFPYYGANFHKSWSKFSRLEFFDKNRIKEAEGKVDLKIHGGSSRGFPQKSFRLNFKSGYTGDFMINVMSQKPHIGSYSAINLRNGGNRTRSDRIFDGLISTISKNTDVDIMAYEPCIVYLNGEFWGIYSIREKMDENYIESNHGIDSDEVDLINGNSRASTNVYVGSDQHFIDTHYELMNTATNDSIFFNLIKNRFEIKNLIDYLIIETYIQNWDWLYNGSNNTKLWRPASSGGKWRHMLYDVDLGFSMFGPQENYIDSCILNPRHDSRHLDLFKRFLQNDDFICLFVSRYTDLVNTIFHTDSFSIFLDSLKNQIESAFPAHIDRWGGGSSYSVSSPPSFTVWENMIQSIENYNDLRVNYSLQHLADKFNLSEITIDMDVIPYNTGSIKINSIIPSIYPWNGVFLNHLCLSNILAIPDSGYVFSHWESNHIIGDQIYNDTIDLYLSQDDTITAHFRECSVSNLSISLDTINNVFSSLFDVGFGPYQFQWFLDSLPIEGINDSIFFPLKTGWYSVLVTDKDSCSSLSNSFFFDCNLLLEPLLTQDTITNSLHINCLGGTEPFSYQWFIDSMSVEYSDKISFDIYTHGTYYAIIEDINGCRSFTDTISNKRLEVNIFPNPTSELMNLQFIRLYGEKYTISVFDLHMNILHYIELPKTDHNMLYTHTFNLDINRTGLYLIRLEFSKNQIAKRFIYIE
jgi:hypothetical protein